MSTRRSAASTRARPTRRSFLQGAAAVAGAGVLGFPAILRGTNLNDRLNLAVIACGGRGAADLSEILKTGMVTTDDIVALCDVDQRQVDRQATKFPNAKKFKDFRKLYDTLKDSEFDAVLVATTEHTHAFATLPALLRKKHIYCEKPLTRDVRECRLITEAAAKAGVATQMGTQGHANPKYHRVVEIIQSGAIGPVREVHVWVSRAWGWQSKEDAEKNKDIVWTVERPKEEDPVPPFLDWDLWIGPAPYRPFNNVYFPGPKWYRWWDFGNGTMSDLGSHRNDPAWWALKLDAPKTIEAKGPPPHPEIAPASMTVTYEYGPRGDLPPVKLTWYQGTPKPPQWTQKQIPQWPDACLFVGSKGMLVADSSRYRLLPEKDFEDFVPPPQTIPPVPGNSHHADWLRACKTGAATGSNFAYAGPMTEANHLGNVAFRAGKKIEWDPKTMKIPNAPEAERFLGREYRKGWSLG